VVTRERHQDQLAFEVELAPGASGGAPLAAAMADALREAIKVRGEVRFVAPGTLPEGARRIDDRRVWK
jgi:phenylacetate-CoA ligase